MRKTLPILFIALLLACSSSPKRKMASVNPPEPVCLEKTTRKACSVNKDGKKVCTCVPDDGEMYRTYP